MLLNIQTRPLGTRIKFMHIEKRNITCTWLGN